MFGLINILSNIIIFGFITYIILLAVIFVLDCMDNKDKDKEKEKDEDNMGIKVHFMPEGKGVIVYIMEYQDGILQTKYVEEFLAPVGRSLQTERINDFWYVFLEMTKEVNKITIEDVNKAYKLLSKKYHPDTNVGSNHLMLLLNRAKEDAIMALNLK